MVTPSNHPLVFLKSLFFQAFEELLAALPVIIIVTAYDQHAIRAFEANALDYLLKPYSDQRFRSAMIRARDRLDERGLRDFAERVA